MYSGVICIHINYCTFVQVFAILVNGCRPRIRAGDPAITPGEVDMNDEALVVVLGWLEDPAELDVAKELEGFGVTQLVSSKGKDKD